MPRDDVVRRKFDRDSGRETVVHRHKEATVVETKHRDGRVDVTVRPEPATIRARND